jgi:prepilin-type N-terminal cleavage/methylation domain-containing protein
VNALRYTAGMRDRESGFTLIELLFTVAVISILAAIALPSFVGESRKAKAMSEVQPLFSDMVTRLEQFLQENGKYPPTVGEGIWNPAGAPSTTRVPLDLAMTEWLPLKLRLSGEDLVYCRYTFATGLANVGTNIGARAAAAPFNFTAPPTDWYYLIAKCDMDGDPAVLSWYFASSTNPKVKPFDEGK